MSKYSNYRQDLTFNQRRKGLHPIWRGIGFLLMILVPVGSYLLMEKILVWNQAKNWFAIPPELISKWIDPLLFVKIIITLLVMLAVYIVLLVITFTMNSLFGPPRYGPTDAPPVDKNALSR